MKLKTESLTQFVRLIFFSSLSIFRTQNTQQNDAKTCPRIQGISILRQISSRMYLLITAGVSTIYR